MEHTTVGARSGLSRRGFLRASLLSGAVLGAGPLLAACGRGEGGGGAAVSAASFPGPSISAHSLSLVQTGGLAEKHGWELDWQTRSTAAAYYNDLIQGGYHYIPFGGADVYARLYNEGAPIKIALASLDYHYPLVAKADSGITSLEDLRGKRVGLPSASYINAQFRVVAQSQGLDVDADSDVAELDIFTAPELLRRGDYDVVPLLFEHTLQMELEEPGGLNVIMSIPGEFGRLLGHDGPAPTYIAVRSDWLEDNTETFGRVADAHAELETFIQDEHDEVIGILSRPMEDGGADLDADIAELAYYSGYEGMRTRWYATPATEVRDQLMQEFEAYVDAGLLDSVPDEGILAQW